MRMLAHAPLLVAWLLEGCGESTRPGPIAEGKRDPSAESGSSTVASDASESGIGVPAAASRTYTAEDFAVFVTLRERACECADVPCADAVQLDFVRFVMERNVDVPEDPMENPAVIETRKMVACLQAVPGFSLSKLRPVAPPAGAPTAP